MIGYCLYVVSGCLSLLLPFVYFLFISYLCQEHLVHPCRCSGISARFAACSDRPLLSLKGVILQYQCLLGSISPPGPYVKRSKTTLLLTHYVIPKTQYMQVSLRVVSHFGSPRLIQPGLKPESKTSTFLPWKDRPDTPWGCQPCCLFWCCSGHTRTWGHTRTLVWIDPCLHELTSCVGWPVYAGWRKGEERGKRKWAVEWWYK